MQHVYFILVNFEVNLTTNYLSIRPYVLCEISWCRYQQLTAISIIRPSALVTKLLVIQQLLQPTLKSAVSAP